MEIAHITTGNWWVILLSFSEMLVIIALMIKTHRIRKKMLFFLSQLSTNERALCAEKWEKMNESFEDDEFLL